MSANQNAVPVIDLCAMISGRQIMKLKINNRTSAVDVLSIELAEKMIACIQTGDIDPIEFAVKKRVINDALDLVLKNPVVLEKIRDLVVPCGKDGARVRNARIVFFSKSTYDYSKDPTWKGLKSKMEPLEKALRQQESRIQSCVRNQANMASEVDGETIATTVPLVSTDAVAVYFK